MGWPSWTESCSTTARGTMSVVLPAPTGTIIRSGFAGQPSARTVPAKHSRNSKGANLTVSPSSAPWAGACEKMVAQGPRIVQYGIRLSAYAASA